MNLTEKTESSVRASERLIKTSTLSYSEQGHDLNAAKSYRISLLWHECWVDHMPKSKLYRPYIIFQAPFLHYVSK